LPGVKAWTTDLEFAYEHGHLYLLDGARHWSDDERIDLRMPAGAGFFVPLRIEGWGGRPVLDLHAWDQVSEFSLDLPSGVLALASGNCGMITAEIAPGAYRARWSSREDAFRLQVWPGSAAAPALELKRRPDTRSDLGDIPALHSDEGVQAVGSVSGTRVRGNALQLYLLLSASAFPRSWRRMIRCDGVVRWQATSEVFSYARLFDEHPGLLPFADDVGGLSFNGRPREPERLARELRAEHAVMAGRHVVFEDGLAERLAVGYGRLASGPVTLLRRYADVAGEHGVATNLTVTGPGRSGLQLLELGDTFVVAERFTAS
jgi:hypothetical protein